MSETNKDIAVAFYKKALFEGRVEDAFRLAMLAAITELKAQLVE
jgi:hypothetical protein